MPIYEYECKKCNARTEVMQKMTDKPHVKCDKCGGRLEKQWSSTSFHLKGTGWYVTDYAAKKPETVTETKEAKAGAEKVTTSKSEEKSTATKTESTTSDTASTTTKKDTPKNASSNTSSD